MCVYHNLHIHHISSSLCTRNRHSIVLLFIHILRIHKHYNTWSISHNCRGRSGIVPVICREFSYPIDLVTSYISFPPLVSLLELLYKFHITPAFIMYIHIVGLSHVIIIQHTLYTISSKVVLNHLLMYILMHRKLVEF